MRTIPLKVIPLTMGDQVIQLSYRHQLAEIMRQPAKQTADLDEVRKSIRVLDALAAAPADAKVLDLEDADYEYMRERVLSAHWPVIDQAIVTFTEDVTEPK